MSTLAHFFQTHPEIALFLTLALGFWLGRYKLGNFSLGVVTSTLLAGVAIGQFDLELSSQLKSVFFLMFLFAVGYGVGPQFFAGLRKDGLRQVIFGVVLAGLCLLTAWVVARIMGYHAGLAAGLLAGASTISAVLGVAGDMINRLPLPAGERDAMVAAIPVAYAVTYLFGTAGSAWILSALVPKLLRIDLAEECRRYEAGMGSAKRPAPGRSAYLRFVARAYRLAPRFAGWKVEELERELRAPLHILRVRQGDQVFPVSPTARLEAGMVIGVVGLRETFVRLGGTLGMETDDPELLDIRGEVLDVVVTNPDAFGRTLAQLAALEPSLQVRGVFLRRMFRGGDEKPLAWDTQVARGDVLQLIGPIEDIERAASWLGYADRATEKSDMLLVGLGIALGAAVGTLAIQVGRIPVGLSTSGGVLIAGLVCGWLRSVRRTFGRVPDAALWVFNNVGLNAFIAVVGINAGPTFVAGLKESGVGLLLSGIVVTTVPFLLAVPFGRYVLKMNPAILIGACAGGRTTTAALGAIEEVAQSHVPALGYTIPYAVGNTMLTISGIAIVLLTS